MQTIGNSPSYSAARQQRIEALIQNGIGFSLLLVEAPPGFGKSQAVEGFLQNNSYRYAWLRLRRMDNWEFFFWTHFITVWAELFPELEQEMRSNDFPYNPAKMSEFLLFMRTNTKPEDRVVLVVDDYSILTNKKIRFFMENLIEADLNNACIIVISSEKTNLRLLCQRINIPMAYIDESVLRFTEQDVVDLFGEYGIAPPKKQVSAIAEKWDGWPIAIWLLAQQGTAAEWDPNYPASITYQLFEKDYFNRYSEPVQKLLVQLSTVERFDNNMVAVLAKDPDAFEKVVEQSPFVFYDYKADVFAYRTAYRNFLARYQDRLTEQDKQNVYFAEAEMMLAKGEREGALPLLLLSGQYDKMVSIIWRLLDVFCEYSKVRFFAQHLAQLPEPYLQKHPLAELELIMLQLLQAQIGEAQKRIDALIERLNASGNDETAILGEAHLLRGWISETTADESFVAHYRIASQYLPNGSHYWSGRPPFLMNANLMKLPDNQPGALDKMEQMYKQSAPFMRKFLGCETVSLDMLFSTEAAYYTYRLDAAHTKALEIAYSASLDQQHELVLLAHFYLARIAMLRGQVEEAERNLKYMEDYIKTHKQYKQAGIKDRVAGYFYIFLGKPQLAPRWLLESGIKEGSLWEAIRNGTVQACYLLQSKRYTEAIALLEYIESLSENKSYWQSVIYFKIYKAMAFHSAGQPRPAIENLKLAYEMSYANNIVTPFIECAGGMRTLLDYAKRTEPAAFDLAWVNKVYAKASGFSKKIMAARKRYERNLGETAYLSPRKLEILKDLGQGYTMEQIAEQKHIAISTVKTHIQSIYSALGAVNRADAVRIAVEKGLI